MMSYCHSNLGSGGRHLRRRKLVRPAAVSASEPGHSGLPGRDFDATAAGAASTADVVAAAAATRDRKV